MRDAFGGAFMIRIMLVFVFLFVFFIAIALNYAKAFRIKNEIINILEENQTCDGGGSALGSGLLSSSIQGITDKYNYSIECKDINTGGLPCINGIVIDPGRSVSKNGVQYNYCNVYVVINHDMGFLKALLTLTSESDDSPMNGSWTIKGQTKTIITE